MSARRARDRGGLGDPRANGSPAARSFLPNPLPRSAKTVRQVDLGPPAERPLRPRRVERAPLELAEPWGVVDDLRLDSGRLRAALPELADRRLAPRADVEDPA